VAVDSLKNLEFLAHEKSVKTGVKITPQDDQALAGIFGDEGRLSQVLINLLSNALKFTEKNGSVEVNAKLIN